MAKNVEVAVISADTEVDGVGFVPLVEHLHDLVAVLAEKKPLRVLVGFVAGMTLDPRLHSCSPGLTLPQAAAGHKKHPRARAGHDTIDPRRLLRDNSRLVEESPTALRLRVKQALAFLASIALLSPPSLPARDFFVPAGTEVVLRLHTTVDTEISQKGDRIICTVEDPVKIDNVEVIPAGARVLGRVGDIKKPGRFGRGGQMTLAFESIEVPGAGNVKISGSLVDLYDPEFEDRTKEKEMEELKGVDLGKEGQVQGAGPSKLKRIGSVAGGGGAGAAAGGVIGAAIGVAVGAGVAFVWFKGKHVELPAGVGMVMRIERELTLSLPDMPATAGSNH